MKRVLTAPCSSRISVPDQLALMNTTLRNILILIGMALLVYLFWYFRSIFAYILIAGVISLIGRPVVDLLNSIRFGNSNSPGP